MQVFPANLDVLASGSRDGTIYIWDTRCNFKDAKGTPALSLHRAHTNVKKKARTSTTTNAGISGLVMTGSRSLVSTGASDGYVKFWDLRSSRSAPVSQCNPNPASRRPFGSFY